ncbi:predicted protein [Chaetoceros tenuissimus]|uniref:C6H2-type domain-containing protein n=1 Tax=Chaetoceros tenuissimus TaxID=426638 RepID=A0AAD3CMH7_9STRA|nr:predicted protein [Chaetoceros tenuissimus]
MESSLLQTKCTRCGKLENEIKFQACPICIELKMLPSVYCCQECFRTDWKSHKKKHDEFADIKSERVGGFKSHPAIKMVGTKKYRKDLRKMSEASYSRTLSLISSSMLVMDYNKAETLCQKAIDEFPSYPEPYWQMACILVDQNELNDAMRFTAVCMEKTCRLLLTVEIKTKGSVDGVNLSHAMQRKKFLDVMNKIFYDLKKNVESTNIVEWVVNDKKFMSLWWYYFEIVKDKNCFDGALSLNPESVTSLLQSRRNQTNQKVSSSLSSSPYYDGEWVIAHGLTSSVGKFLNHRVAMVKGDDLNDEGRVAVVFEEGGQIKTLKVENLKRASTVNKKAALLMFLDESEQWNFMMDDFLTS